MTPDPRATISKNIQMFREEIGMTQDEFADLVGVMRNTVARWEQGARKISTIDLKRVADAVGRRIDDFYSEDPPALKTPPRIKAFAVKSLRKDVPEDLRKKAEELIERLNQEDADRLSHGRRQRSTRASPSSREGEDLEAIEAELEYDRLERERLEREISEEKIRPKATRHARAAMPSQPVRERSPLLPERHGRPR